MKDPNFSLHFAVGSKQYLEFLLTCGAKNILISFAYPEPWRMKNIMKRHNIKLLCDSGAFTSWNLAARQKAAGDPNWERHLVDIDKYYEFLEKHKDIIYRAVNLDIIPGEQGQKPTEEQIEEAAEGGWKNYLYLKEKGWNTIHVFHQGESFKHLNRMLDNCDYIGVSPCNDSSEKSKFEWMDHVFRHICKYDYSKNPYIKEGEIIKTHGFAVTSKTLVMRFPWFSVDSSSYSLTAAKGTIITPYGRIYVSDQNLHDPDHLINRPEQIRRHINNYLEEKIGYGINSMIEKKQGYEGECPKCSYPLDEFKVKAQPYKSRNFANINYFIELEEARRLNGPSLDFLKQGTLL